MRHRKLRAKQPTINEKAIHRVVTRKRKFGRMNTKTSFKEYRRKFVNRTAESLTSAYQLIFRGYHDYFIKKMIDSVASGFDD